MILFHWERQSDDCRVLQNENWMEGKIVLVAFFSLCFSLVKITWSAHFSLLITVVLDVKELDFLYYCLMIHSWQYLTFDHNRAGFLMFLVERAKKCLDFCATLYIMHLFICILYGGWPASITWWVVNITGLAVMALLGEYLCMKRELREIPISRYRSSKPFSVLTKCFLLKNYF